MNQIGIVEGFFGPAWSPLARLSFAPFLKKYGGDFYFYAPKRDSHLRKLWREDWDSEYLNFLADLRFKFQSHGIKFGLGLSPFGLGSSISEEDWNFLKQKFKILSDLKIDYLGLFFDDMPSTDKLLEVQVEVIKLAQQFFPSGLIFCPSYYSFDPILDKVFGPRPIGYVEALAKSIPSGVEICWTGPKVISDEISPEHLLEVQRLLGRKPFIWENLFANDGPRNCKFLKFRDFKGRDQNFTTDTSGIAFNLMNQPFLSQIVYLASLFVLNRRFNSDKAFEASCFELCSPQLAEVIIKNRELFLNEGLDKIPDSKKRELLEELKKEGSPHAHELLEWLNGKYIVGPECLTD